MSANSDEFPACKERDSCRTYLLTYSQADMEKVPDCRVFADIVLEGFNQGPSASQILQWAVCKEQHTNGGEHYHMILKLSRTRRWKPVFNYLRESHHVTVNFSSSNIGYLAGYRYISKDKSRDSVLHSVNHPDLSSAQSPQAKKAFSRFASNAKKRRSSAAAATQEENKPPPENSDPERSAPPKQKRLSNSDVGKFIIKNNLKTETALMAMANKREAEGLSDIYNFLFNKTTKARCELIETAWRIHNAPAVIERENMNRMDVVVSYLDKPCVDGCNGQWLRCAREVLVNNDINIYVFANAIRRFLKYGRKKGNNIMLAGETNCAKSFLLNPLEVMFKAFVNPAAGRYAWIGLDEVEIIFINDFRWSEELIKWNDFLLLLEGQTVHLPRPKNQFVSDLVIRKENILPFFGTTKEPIEYVGPFYTKDDRETEMLNARLKYFNFTHRIENKIEMDECPHCFAVMVTSGMRIVVWKTLC